MPNNILITGNAEYPLTKFYRLGALAQRRSVPLDCNPHRKNTRAHDDWGYGHVHESVGIHAKDGVDILAEAPTGTLFEIEEILASYVPMERL